MSRMASRTVQLDVEQHARLRALSERTKVPAGEYVREGLARLLDLAERQLRTIDAAVARQERKP